MHDQRAAGGFLIVGAILAILGNAIHPFFASPPSVATIVETAGTTRSWVAVHLVLVVSTLLLATGVVLLARWLGPGDGSAAAVAAAVSAVVGGGIFVVQLGGLDGRVMTSLADMLADTGDEELVLAVATGLAELDVALLSLGVMLFVGATFAALGVALIQREVFAPWIRWGALAGGTAGVVVGGMMYLSTASGFTPIAFRVVAFAVTLLGLAIGLLLRRGTVLPERTPAS